MTKIISSNKLIKTLLICIPLFTLTACGNQVDDIIEDILDGTDETACGEDVTTVNFKQIAYWSVSDEETLDDIDFGMLTHIIYSKIGVESDGDLILPTGDDLDEFEEMIELAQDAGVFAMVSFGNSSDSAFNAIAASDTALDNFADNVEDLIKEYDLDGIDINWQFPENDDEGDLFEDLVKEISEVAEDQGVLFSFVVDTGQDDDATDDGVQDDTLDYPDFINVMALNTTDNDDLHSSLEDAEDAIEYWTDRCVVKNKLVLAIPLYSDGDGELSFREIADDDLDNVCVDEAVNVEDEDGNRFDDINYNGIPTVNDKTEYAQSFAGGVILSSLEQDYFEEGDFYSILAAVDWQVAGGPNDICD
ncbi:glycoside hydrolase family 18 protein [Psychromonas sp. L1A2]|uniref:glycoside hydrolase family 18 protein n=1 Tax=Psychromonas sp. L1A2 TaxID=2686356 RepID=UPI001359D0C4|nr:glycoside hydrolase family 18 protein [Psychromonas sp. L1A2]